MALAGLRSKSQPQTVGFCPWEFSWGKTSICIYVDSWAASAPWPCGETQAVWLYFSFCLPKQVLFPSGFCLSSLQLVVSSQVPYSMYQTRHQMQSCGASAAHVASVVCTSVEISEAAFAAPMLSRCFLLIWRMQFWESQATGLVAWLTGDWWSKMLVSVWDWQTQRCQASLWFGLFNMILEVRRAIKYPCLQIYATYAFHLLGI